MASSDVQRKLTAILCADVVGYSRLMGENERATLRTLTDYRQVFSGNLPGNGPHLGRPAIFRSGEIAKI
ncbi:MAG: hypothetical protein V3S64_09060 [bacterium]